MYLLEKVMPSLTGAHPYLVHAFSVRPSYTGDLSMHNVFIPHEATGDMAAVVTTGLYIPISATSHTLCGPSLSPHLQKDKGSPPPDYRRAHRACGVSGMFT